MRMESTTSTTRTTTSTTSTSSGDLSQFAPELPVAAIRERFNDAAQPRTATVVVAETGSGKSTCLPLWLCDLRGRTLVVEPRRLACQALASWLSELIGEEVGGRIGYRVRFDTRVSDQTVVEFVTPGIAVRMLAEGAGDWGAVLVDEAHERSTDVDLTILLMRRAIELGASDAALVLTSATIDGEGIAATLKAPLLRADGRTFPVTIEHIGDGEPSRRDLDGRVTRALTELVRQEANGDILVFLPGMADIDRCAKAVAAVSALRALEIVRVHGALASAQSLSLLKAGTKRRVYLSTNIAETSLTLPGVRAVVDSGLARQRMHRGGRSALVVAAVSEASMLQRAGRAGRVQAGRCIRLWSSRFSPRPTTRPEIERVELDDLLLQAGFAGVDGADFDRAPWLTPPPEFALEAARSRLRASGALDENNALTELGRDMSAWPTSARLAGLLIGASDELLPTLCDMVAITDGPDFVLNVSGLAEVERGEVIRARIECAGREAPAASIGLLRRGDARLHHLHPGRLKQTRRIADDLRTRAGVKSRCRADRSPVPPANAIAGHILPRWPECGFAPRPRATKKSGRGARSEPWSNGSDELLVRVPLSEESSEGAWSPDSHGARRAAMVLTHEWLSDRGSRVVGYAGWMIPISPALLAEHGAVDIVVAEARYDRSKRRVVAAVRRELGGAVLAENDEVLRGPPLLDALAEFISRGRFIAGAADIVADGLHNVRVAMADPSLVCANSEAQSPLLQRCLAADPALAVSMFVRARIEEAGVEGVGDLSLLSVEDFAISVPDELGCDAWAAERLANDLPRVWTHIGADYACSVHHSGRVTLSPSNAEARRSGEPPKSALPRFRGFAIFYQKASRRVRLR